MLVAIGCSAGGSRSLEDDLYAYMADRANQGFSGAVLVRVGNRTLVDRGYGLADRERGIQVRPDTVFEVGSITKVFTAATVVRLAEERKLRLDDRLPRFFARVPPGKRAITIRHLLAHRSGLPEYAGYGDLHALSRRQAVRNALALPLHFRPGARQAYSNVGYTLLAAIVERVTGRPFALAVRQRVIRPAGMTRTAFFGERAWGRDHLAVGYGNRAAPDRRMTVSWSVQGAGGALSTTADLARLVDAVRGGRIVRPASVPLLYRLAIGPSDGPVAYGGANTFGFQATIVELPRERALIVVLTNSNMLPNLVADDVAQGLERRIAPRRS
jgi:CubicO group peptidase (beta-lactamase class C family)